MMDEYAVRDLAQRAAEEAANNVRSDLGYRLDDMQREIDRLRSELDDERSARREVDAHLSDALASVGG
jgi:phage host-nuclease inhibitor protein Gam